MLADAEGQVVVRRAADVEAVGLREDVLVAVGGDVPENDLVTFGDGLPADGRVGHRRAAEVQHR